MKRWICIMMFVLLAVGMFLPMENVWAETDISHADKVQAEGSTETGLTTGRKGFTARWKKPQEQITGYELQYSTSRKFKGAKTIKAKTTSKKITKLKARKKYYVRIRTYKNVKVNGKFTKLCSGWSKAKKVTTKR